MSGLPDLIDARVVLWFVNANYDQIEANLDLVKSQSQNSRTVNTIDLLADIAILQKDQRLLSYLGFHPRYLIDKHKNDYDKLEFLLDFLSTNSHNLTCYDYYLEGLTDRTTLDLYAKYGMDFSTCDVNVIEHPVLQEIAIQYGVPDTRVDFDRFITYLEHYRYGGDELTFELMDEIESRFDEYYDEYVSTLSDDWKDWIQKEF